jgi:hypothetical protein
MRLTVVLGTLPALLLTACCGYHTSGRAELVPKTVHTISIPAFNNATTRYKLTDQLPEAIAREFIARTRYRIISNPEAADAVLEGTVLSYGSFPTVFDPVTSRASAVELHVTMHISLRERATGKILYLRPNFEIRERYQISIDPAAYFEESDSALARASQQTARQVVSSILEAF